MLLLSLELDFLFLIDYTANVMFNLIRLINLKKNSSVYCSTFISLKKVALARGQTKRKTWMMFEVMMILLDDTT